ncbi:hypothetical protein PAJ34TS1_29490 [Paenibacillus azoreducens]|uniref:RNA polymerase sigma factor n=2 Tax=Paenibacillus azoreducens TaxID=116718 RepID=A0A919YCF5_9BACL|nr:hypothetical protein J34TS1_19180 [Paenibacillus azoreducens]
MNHMQGAVTDIKEMNDADLVKEAQSGSREAFGELIRRHRSKVYGYARSMMRETHAAEDLVQDALIRAFLHLGKLVDVERFLPWVHRIVRNQAMTRLRKEGRRQEVTFTSLENGAGSFEEEPEKWNRLDYVLKRISQSMEAESRKADIPEERLMRMEMQHVLLDIISCLKPRERQVFEAHFFDQLSPQEIARQFSLSSANVYQILSRSRKKVIQERIRITVDSYIQTRRDWGKMSKMILTAEQEASWCTAGSVLHGLVQATDQKQSLAMVMGLTGLAFRINVLPENVHIAGPTSFDFADIFTKGMRNLGLNVRIVNGLTPGIGENTNLMDESKKGPNAMLKRDIHQALPKALDLIQQSLDRGYPVMAWDLCIPEFGILYGYDDEQKVLYFNECGRKDTLPYENLGRGVMEEIFVLAVDSTFDLPFRERARGALEMILDHYHGRETKIPAEAVKGLAAYDAWIAAFRNKTVEPNGNAYNIVVIGESRKYAAQFLSELARSWDRSGEADTKAASLLMDASETYRGLGEAFDELHMLFPYPQGGEPNDKDGVTQAVSLLEKAKMLETQGARQLEDILQTL